MKNAWRSPGAGAALIILLTLVAYLPAMRGGFVFDDETLIVNNPMVKAGDGLYRFWFTTEAPDYYPLTWSLWWTEWRLWGANAGGYHVVNVLLHAINSVLVWMILRRLKIPGAWLAGLVFAVHPVNVATVAWISEQKNTLSMLFFLAAILSYLRFDEESRWKWYADSLAAFLLALLSKTAVVMLPVVLLGCAWWRHAEVRRKDVWRSVPFFALSLALGLATVWFQYNRVLKGSAVRTDGFLGRLAVAGYAVWFYLYKALLPLNLSAVYSRWDIRTSLWASYLPGALLLGCLTFFWWKRKTWGRPMLFALGYFVVTLFPVLGFFDQDFYQYSFVSDHWQYFSIIGVIGLAVAAGVTIGRRLCGQRRSWGAAPVVVVLMALGAGTWRRGVVYASEETLWQDTVAKNPDGWMPHYNLGTCLLQAGRLEAAIAQLEHAARIRPDLAKVQSNLGIALAQAGRVQEAVMHFERALRIDPNLAEAHGNLGHALMLLGDEPKAIEHWEQALRIQPDNAEIQYDLGLALEQAGRPADALEHYQQALQLKPDYAEARNGLARLRAPR